MEARYVGYNTRMRFRDSLDWSSFKWSLAHEDELIAFEDIVDWNGVNWRSISTASTLEKLFHRCPETARRDLIARVCSQLIGSKIHYTEDYYYSDVYLSGGWGRWQEFFDGYLRKPKEHFSKAFLEQHWKLFEFQDLRAQNCPEKVLFDALVHSSRPESENLRFRRTMVHSDDWKYVSARMKLSDDFIRQHANEVHWPAICRFQDISHELLMEFRKRIVVYDLYHSKFIKYETVRTFFDQSDQLWRQEPTEAIKRVIKEAHRQIVIRDLTTRVPTILVKHIIEYLT